jgi:hypothetical protein
MKTRLGGVLTAILGVAIGVVPSYTECTVSRMKCHWTGQAELVLAVPILVLGILSVVSRQRETRMVLGLLGLVLGVLVILPPTVLIGVCPGSMDCNAVMKPSMILMGGLVAAVNLASGIFSGLGRGKTRSRSE